MVKESDHRGPEINEVHRCTVHCLGPLAFHTQTKGESIRLSDHGQCAQRLADTFKDGLLFSCRSVRVQERVRLRIDEHKLNWTGAIRVGFTNVPPSARAGPLPCLAIPCLTETPGHWAAPIADHLVQAGSLLEFWVTGRGTLHVCVNNSIGGKLLTGVDVSRPLWAMIDVYGQTCAVTLLGSVKKELLRTRKSCVPPEYRDDIIPMLVPKTPKGKGSCDDCVVCLEKEARIIVKPCGHQCLCANCAIRVLEEFTTCPLCRQKIGTIAAQ